jgi:hypothetical protein
MASIWHSEETPGFDKSKKNTSFSKWKMIVVEKLVTDGVDRDEALDRLQSFTLVEIGLNYDNNMTAEEMAAKCMRR